MRKAELARKTAETDISLRIELDGSGKYDIDTGCGFLDHMLELFAKHGRFDLNVKCKGDIKVDYHHTAEDIAIVLGKCFASALGDCRGITRYGSFMLAMDEALVLCALDISGRSYLGYDLYIPTEKIGDFDSELVKEFMYALVRNMNITLHLKQLAGENSHHIAEGAFKALARALAQAVKIDEEYKNEIPSSKGTII